MNKKAGVLAVLVVMFPLITKIPFLNESIVQAYILGPVVWFWFTTSMMAALWILTEDRWLGVLACWYALMILWNPHHWGVETTQEVIFGLALVVVARRWFDRQLFLRMLEVVAVIEVALVVVQACGFDLIWTGWIETDKRPGGTFGNRTYVAAFLSMLVPVASPIAMGIMLVGLAFLKSVTGLVAVFVGLLIRFPQWRRELAGLGVLVVGWALYEHVAAVVSFTSRFKVWWLAVSSFDLSTFVRGQGPGMWFKLVPQLQLHHHVELREGAFGYAHNELLQLLFDAGVVGVIPVVLWLKERWKMFLEPERAGLAALFVTSMAMFPFHLATVGVPAACLVGVLTKEKEESRCSRS